MEKLNCWEVKNCGREQAGAKVAEFGICPAATETKTDGINSGKNGGRACWVVAGTFCGGRVQGKFAEKLQNCIACEFYSKVRDEEGDNYMMSRAIIKGCNLA